MIFLSLAPLLIASLVVSLLLKQPWLVLVGIAIIFGVFAVAIRRQKSLSRRRYTSSPDDWMSKAGFYVGPFDSSGLPGAASFNRQYSRAGHPPQVRLVVTDEGLEFGPAGQSGSPEIVPFGWMRTLDLIDGTHARKVLISPPVADQRGQVVVTTTEGKVARFSGIPISGIRAALEARGASIENIPS